MKKPNLKKYSGVKKKIQTKLFHKKLRKGSLPSLTDSRADDTLPGTTFSFFEDIAYGKSKNNQSDRYYFSSTRKGYNYYGIIVKIFRGGHNQEVDQVSILYQEEGLQIYKNVYDGNNFTSFAEHIKHLGIGNYVVELKDVMKEYYDKGTYPYTALELKIYLDDINTKVGKYDSPKLYQTLKDAFYDTTFQYFQEESFALFCGLEELHLEKEYASLLLSDLYSLTKSPDKERITHADDWWIGNYIFDLQNFSNGFNGNLLFEDFPLQEIISQGNISIFSPALYEEPLEISTPNGRASYGIPFWAEESKARVLKIVNFKNSEKNYWFLYLIKNPLIEDDIEYLSKVFLENGFDISG